MASWLYSLCGATVLLAVSIQVVEKSFSPLARLVVSLFFALAWIALGSRVVLLPRQSQETELGGVHGRWKLVGWMLVSFGFLWALISVIQFLKPAI